MTSRASPVKEWAWLPKFSGTTYPAPPIDYPGHATGSSFQLHASSVLPPLPWFGHSLFWSLKGKLFYLYLLAGTFVWPSCMLYTCIYCVLLVTMVVAVTGQSVYQQEVICTCIQCKDWNWVFQLVLLNVFRYIYWHVLVTFHIPFYFSERRGYQQAVQGLDSCSDQTVGYA